MTLGFHAGRAITGWYFDHGHGGDFCERWRVERQHLVMRDAYGGHRCLYHLDVERSALILGDCKRAGEWKREQGPDPREWFCRTQPLIEEDE